MATKKSEAFWEKEAERIREKLGVKKAFSPDQIMTFGKYKGKALKELPDDYLMWLYNESDLIEKVRLFLFIDADLPLTMGIIHDRRVKNK